MVAPMPGQENTVEEVNMFPVGTEVTFKEFHGWVKFCDPETGTCSICIKIFENDPARNVCMIVNKNDMKNVVPVIGNHSRS